MWPSEDFPTLAPEEAGVPFARPLPTSERATYDYIIVGGGTAGSCLASRLSEDPNVTVLLLERGGVSNGWMDRVPLISSNPYRAGAPVGRWWSQPLPMSRSPEGQSRSLEVVCGEALGGTSAINSTFYTRGPAGDYNRWQELGNEGWGYSDLEPYFAKSEHTHSHPESHYRGKQGPWQNRTYHINVYKHTQHVIRAAERAGIQAMEDLNSPMAPAVGYVRQDVSHDSKARRHGPFHAFLPPALVRARKSRLKICTNALATRLEFAIDDSGHLRAVGVHFEVTDYRYAGKSFFARARREVVVCSGALGSPQLLQLSGLGPRELLEAKGIAVVRDMPGVGSRLQDHVAVPLTFEAPMNDSLHELEASPLKVVKELATYIISGGGLLSYPFQAVTIYLPSRLLDKDSNLSVADKQALDTTVLANCPDLEVMPAANNCTDHDIPGKGMFTFIIGLIRPKSYGSVRLATSNPRARPEVDLGFLTNPDDLIPLRKGIKLGMRLARDMRDQGYPLKDLIVPESMDDSSLDTFISQNIRTCYHYTSTCRMGRVDDPERPAVVDSELRVHGVRGLRVCDASVFPEIIGGHTMAPVVVVAEKCADLIKNTYRTGAV
ncbi:GMC oxidoreductase [Trametes sanguinea]|nr:GMC oxidoreductase [Trametes sanguinea]